MGYHDIDSLVCDAIERGDFCSARSFVLMNRECLSQSDKHQLLMAIAEAEANAVTE
jgi:hypothetical protein